jgi:hypothetical protein
VADRCAALLGFDGFRVLGQAELGGELELLVETTADLVGCPGCRGVAWPGPRTAVRPGCGTCRSVVVRSCCAGGSRNL